MESMSKSLYLIFIPVAVLLGVPIAMYAPPLFEGYVFTQAEKHENDIRDCKNSLNGLGCPVPLNGFPGYTTQDSKGWPFMYKGKITHTDMSGEIGPSRSVDRPQLLAADILLTCGVLYGVLVGGAYGVSNIVHRTQQKSRST